MSESKEELIGKLTDMFHEVSPDEDYLDDDQDTADDIVRIDAQLDDSTESLENKIKALYTFNAEWFPDGLSQSEQKEYQDLLDQAEALIKK